MKKKQDVDQAELLRVLFNRCMVLHGKKGGCKFCAITDECLRYRSVAKDGDGDG